MTVRGNHDRHKTQLVQVGDLKVGAGTTADPIIMTSLKDYLAQNPVNIKSYPYNAAGDGLSDDTAAIEAARAVAVAAVRPLYFPPGTYLVDNFLYGQPATGAQIPIIGAGSRATKLKKRTSDGGPLFKISSATASAYTSLISMSGMTLEGIAGDTSACLQAYDVVRTKFEDIVCTKALIGFEFRGGIGNVGINCQADTCVTGLLATRYTGGYDGWPNLNTFIASRFLSNTSWGVDFDYGIYLKLETCDIESNGTNGNASTGGVRVGANVGANGGAGESIGLIVDGGWLEANAGNAAIQWASGRNHLRAVNLVGNANATYDTYASGGQYTIEDCDYDTLKSPNHFETAGVLAGNMIINSTPARTVDATKTTVFDFVNGLLSAVDVTMPNIRLANAGGVIWPARGSVASLADGSFNYRPSSGSQAAVSALPVAATAGAGARSYVTDANATTFNSIVAGSGANGVPVFSDGTNWRIG